MARSEATNNERNGLRVMVSLPLSVRGGRPSKLERGSTQNPSRELAYLLWRLHSSG
jgi:hypothetical protein